MKKTTRALELLEAGELRTHELANALDITSANASALLGNLVRQGRVARTAHGVYELPAQSADRLSLADVIQIAAAELPPHYTLSVHVESGSAWVEVGYLWKRRVPVPDAADKSIEEQALDALRAAVLHSGITAPKPAPGDAADRGAPQGGKHDPI